MGAQLEGSLLGTYRVLKRIGGGGMGVVYLAEHHLIGRKAAIKVLLPELSRDQELVQRFFNEARSTALIKHPGLVDIFEFGYHADGSAYLIMEFLDGESLGERLRRERRLAWEPLVVFSRQIANALGAAHAAGIVHRDLKPDNVFLVPDPEVALGTRVKILDFGIAKLGGYGGVVSRTRTGALMGTPLYMSPEQCRGAGEVDHRADVYSLGCMMFEMACGRPPFVAEGAGEIIAAHIHEPPQAPSAFEPSIPPALEDVIMRALAKKIEHRWQSMGELAATLKGLASGTESPSGQLHAAGFASVAAGGVPPTALPWAAGPTTTLGGSAAEIAGPAPIRTTKKRTRLAAATGAAVVLVAGAIAVYTMRRNASSPAATQAAATQLAPDAAVPGPPPDPTVGAASAVDAGPRAEPAPIEAPRSAPASPAKKKPAAEDAAEREKRAPMPTTDAKPDQQPQQASGTKPPPPAAGGAAREPAAWAGRPHGKLPVLWWLYLDGAPAKCTAIGAVTVEILSEEISTGLKVKDRYRCSPPGGVVELPAGKYWLTITVLDQHGRVLATAKQPGLVRARPSASPKVTFKLSFRKR